MQYVILIELELIIHLRRSVGLAFPSGRILADEG